ncbi:hypothetical protein ODS41_04970 [Pyrobaculum sp. 3827-6]|nr:hypothetical protein [Pyrobaculum sp. 3827-6]MCU7787274.1 hypothetical protein [Pyrobaculum sp. 3827-6]
MEYVTVATAAVAEASPTSAPAGDCPRLPAPRFKVLYREAGIDSWRLY